MDSTLEHAKSRIAAIPTGAGVGAEIRRRRSARDRRRRFRRDLTAPGLEHSVLLFRGQTLTDDDLIAFSRRFGALDFAPIQENGRRFVEGHPEIYVVSNVIENGVAIGSLGAGEAVWHTDMSYLARPAQGEHALRARSAAGGRQHRLLQHVPRLRGAAGGAEARASPGCGSSTTAPTTAAAICARASPRPTIRAARPAPSIRWSARIRRPGGAASISGGGATPISSGWSSRSRRRCSTSSGPMPTRGTRPGTTRGGSAISSCGTTAAPCTGAIRSMPTPAGHAPHPDQMRGPAERVRRRAALTPPPRAAPARLPARCGGVLPACRSP